MVRRNGFVNVDELMPQVDLEQVATFYGVPLPDLHRTGQEIRTKCFLNCGRTEETGDRALAIKADHPAKQWRCHHYGCGKGGNLVGMCDLLAGGTNMQGRPRGERFKTIAADLREMVEGRRPEASQTKPTPAPSPPAVKEEPVVNVPLRNSVNERARGLVNLDEKFLIDPNESMNKDAARYFRSRPFLSTEACRKFRMGYLPRDAGGDRSGGTMRGKIVYPMLSEKGEVLTWFGRDPEYENKHHKWISGGKQGREPEKFHFVKGFHRRLEFFGQNAKRLNEPGYREALKQVGIIVVEGPNDVIALDCLGVPAVGLCSNTIAREQVAKLARWARQLGNNRVTLMLDNDVEGENGMKQALFQLAQHCDVRLAWSREMYGGRFRDRQPESMDADEWLEIPKYLQRGVN